MKVLAKVDPDGSPESIRRDVKMIEWWFDMVKSIWIHPDKVRFASEKKKRGNGIPECYPEELPEPQRKR
jgi:hypothetical protein